MTTDCYCKAREAVENYQEGFGSVSLAELLVCIGFFLVYLVEELTHIALHIASRKNKVLHRCVSQD